MNTTPIVDQLSSMTAMQIIDLTKRLEQRWGVSSAPVAPKVVQITPPPGDGGTPETSLYSVQLSSFGEGKKIEVIRALRTSVRTDLNLLDAKNLVESAPTTVLSDVLQSVANEAADKLRAAGAVVELKPI